MKEKRKLRQLQLLSAIGFSGKVVSGLRLLPDRGLVYPVGVGVGVWDRAKGRHAILHSHNRPVSALAVSASGKFIVSAQDSDPGCQARVVIWRYQDRDEYGSYCVHREEIAAVGVSANDEYVASLGGLLDGYLILWHIPTKKPLCSVIAGEPGLGNPSLLHTAPITSTLILVGGQRILRAWTLNPQCNRMTAVPIALGILERNYTCLQLDEYEEFLYACTTTGDIVKVRLNLTDGKSVSGGPVLIAVMAPKPFPEAGGSKLSRAPTPGIQTFIVLPGGDIIVGEQGGTLRAYRQDDTLDEKGRPLSMPSKRAHGTVKYTHPKDPTRPLLTQLWCVEIGAIINSLSVVDDILIIGTANSEIYELHLPNAANSESNNGRSEAKANSYNRRRDVIRSADNTKRQPGSHITVVSKPEVPKHHKTSVNGIDDPKTKATDQRRSATEERRLSNRAEFTATMKPPFKLGSDAPPVQLLSTCHSEPVYDVTFPKDVGELVVTAGVGGVRVWNIRSLEEVLRVQLPGLVCSCCCVTHSLHTIVTGWSDGRLRGLGAESGRVIWVVDDAHHGGVNTVVTLNDGQLISGGRDGRVRVWRVGPSGVRMLITQKEHRGDVTHITLNADETRVLSCSGDGTCILWELPSLSRVYTLTAHTVFLGGQVLSSGEMVTVGSDGSVLVWERQDGALLADLPASTKPITTIVASEDDSTLSTAGEDGIIRVWNWVKGRITHEGRGHSGEITRVSISPDNKILASVGKDGALLFWKLP